MLRVCIRIEVASWGKIDVERGYKIRGSELGKDRCR